MCSHNSLNKKASEIEEPYHARFVMPEAFEPIYHASGFKHGAWPVITGEFPCIIQLFRWGLIPKWTRGMDEAEKIRVYNINAKAETIYEKRSFAASIKYSRCLIPSTGYYDWRQDGKKKVPYYIYMKNESIFSMAGIWSSWVHRETEHQYHTFSIVTTKANSLFANDAKKRMPLILPKDKEADWLNYDLDKEGIKSLFLPYGENEMMARIVSPFDYAQDNIGI